MLFPTIISRLFEPLTMIVILIILPALQSGLVGWELVRVLGIIISVIVIPPVCILVWAMKNHYVKNWDLSDRKERLRALAIFSLFLFVDWIFIQWIAPPSMMKLFLSYLFVFAGFFAVTLFSKISGHMVFSTFLFFMLWYWYGPQMLWLFVFLPILGWSRLVLKRHTLGEVLGGTAYAVCIFFLAQGLHLI